MVPNSRSPPRLGQNERSRHRSSPRASRSSVGEIGGRQDKYDSAPRGGWIARSQIRATEPTVYEHRERPPERVISWLTERLDMNFWSQSFHTSQLDCGTTQLGGMREDRFGEGPTIVAIVKNVAIVIVIDLDTTGRWQRILLS